MSCTRSNFNDFKEGITSGKFLDAFDKHFHSDYDMYEQGELKDCRKGKANNRAFQENFIKMAKINSISISRSIVEGDTAVYEMQMDFEIGGNPVKKTQWIVQTWKDGQIIKEEYL